jgi:ubiquitin carboxyl-terminal hydrolase L5
MEDSSGWCTIESDPGVFTELVEAVGVKGVEFQEVVSLDDQTLASLGDVLGFIFLFKFEEKSQPRAVMEYTPQGLFYAKQVIHNACATQAILSVLLNLSADQADIGETLRELKSFTEGLDDESRGFAIGNSEVIRTAHNSFKPNISLEISHEDDKKKGEAFHFVSYVWVNGKVYELDGLQSGPVLVGECPDRENWTSIAVPYVHSRMQEYMTNSEIRFNLMAVTRDQREDLRSQLASFPDKSDPVAVEIQSRLYEIEVRRSKWTMENARRRHDFIPLGLACLETLARQGKLVQLFEAARSSSRS